MKATKLGAMMAGLLLTAGVANAAHIWEDPNGWWNYDQNAPKYTANELSLDLFGSYRNPEGKLTDLFNTSIRHGAWGGGAGLNYFFTRQVGLGADFNMSDKPGDRLVDYAVGNLYIRFPMGNSGFSPYFFGGGGRGFSPVYEWVYGGGVGLEYRVSPVTGIFSDARFLWSDKSTSLDTLTIRAGVRFIF
jgi:hypothetical protein